MKLYHNHHFTDPDLLPKLLCLLAFVLGISLGVWKLNTAKSVSQITPAQIEQVAAQL
jgi:hypothetical protein